MVPRWLGGKESACQCRKCEFDPWVGKNPPREGNGNALQCSCLENSIDRSTQWATVHQGHKESDTAEHCRHIVWFPKPKKVFPSCPFQNKFASSKLGHRFSYPAQSLLSRGGLPRPRDLVFSPAATVSPPTPQPPTLPSTLFHHST